MKRFIIIATIAIIALAPVATHAQDNAQPAPVAPEPTFTLHDMRGYLAYSGIPFASIAAASCMPAQEAGQFVWCLVPLDGEWMQWIIVWRAADWRMRHTEMVWCEGDCG